MEIRPLTGIDFDTLYEAFDEAFADYDTHFGKEQLRRMLKRRGYCPDLSFAAFDGERIAAFTLNGTGMHGGIPTAYDTGTGTLKAYWGTGLAKRIFRHSIPRLQAAGIGQYLLEVLQHNAKAISVYRSLGFETTREFSYFIHPKKAVCDTGREAGFPCEIRPLELRAAEALAAFEDFEPAWQNSTASIRRAAEDLVGLGLFHGETPAGYCILEPATGDIPRIAVAPAYRHRGVGSTLLRRAIAASDSELVRIINTEHPCPSIDGFLRKWGIEATGRQFEMIRKL